MKEGINESTNAPKKPIVPPLLVNTPMAPWLCEPRAFWTVLTRVPTRAAWRPTALAYLTVGRGSKVSPPLALGFEPSSLSMTRALLCVLGTELDDEDGSSLYNPDT